jgi:hypothetical protein
MSKYEYWKAEHDRQHQAAMEAFNKFLESVKEGKGVKWGEWEQYKQLTKKVNHAWGVLNRCKPA